MAKIHVHTCGFKYFTVTKKSSTPATNHNRRFEAMSYSDMLKINYPIYNIHFTLNLEH